MFATAMLAGALLSSAGPTITNPYFPLPPGRQWVYREGRQRVEVTVTDRTKRIANGVEARVVRDEVTLKGVPVEITDDYYAQDRQGNVWYLGEATTEYEHGKPVSTEGSFEAGRRRREGRHRHAGPPEGRDALPAGVLRRARRGPRQGRVAARAREGPAEALPRTR